MDGVGPAISRARCQRFRFNDLDDLRLSRIRLGIDHMDSRGANARHNQITPFGMGMRSEWTQAGAACIPTEVTQLVAAILHVPTAARLPVGTRNPIDIDN